MENILDLFVKDYETSKKEVLSLNEYLELCKKDPMAYATAAERMVKAIGEPELVDTSKDPRLSRIFGNRTIKVYPSFKDKFFGMEDTIERIVSFFRHAAQGLEEKKQVLYLLGPVGSAKSSLAEHIKELAEVYPIYTLQAGDEISPVFESPLGLFNISKYGKLLEENYNINSRYLTGIMSPWAIKRLKEFGGDIRKFKVVRLNPSKLEQICIMKTEPGDDNNQDISALVGKVNIRKLEHFDQNDPDCYSFSGALNRTTQGLMEFVEMFKSSIKILHPLLTATQEGNYTGTESLGGIPYQGIILAHSNESEWQTFKSNRNNEAFLDRIKVIKVPYCLRLDEETEIYRKMIKGSSIKFAPCAPQTLEMLSEFTVLSRLKEHENSNLYSKMRAYNGENLKDVDPRAKSINEYRDLAGQDEGMDGISTRFAYKVLSDTFNFDINEIAADPVHLMYVLEKSIKAEQFSEEREKQLIGFIKSELSPRYAEFIGNEIQKAYLESYGEYGQALYDRYIEYADAWIEDTDYKDPDTGILMNRDALNEELTKTEKSAGISNPKDWRQEVVKFNLRARAKPENKGKNPKWTSYSKMAEVIEKRMFNSMEELLPVISFESKKDKSTERKHNEFVDRMKEKGYSLIQIRRICDWYMRISKSS